MWDPILRPSGNGALRPISYCAILFHVVRAFNLIIDGHRVTRNSAKRTKMTGYLKGSKYLFLKLGNLRENNAFHLQEILA